MDHQADGETYFTEVADTAFGILGSDFGEAQLRIHRRGVKLWFGEEHREHYEAQLISGGAIEIGFHSEHTKAAQNQSVLDALVAHEPRWREELGDEAVAGIFLGDRSERWRRISEVWEDPDVLDQDVAMEVGDRLAAYVTALELVRRSPRT